MFNFENRNKCSYFSGGICWFGHTFLWVVLAIKQSYILQFDCSIQLWQTRLCLILTVKQLFSRKVEYCSKVLGKLTKEFQISIALIYFTRSFEPEIKNEALIKKFAFWIFLSVSEWYCRDKLFIFSWAFKIWSGILWDHSLLKRQSTTKNLETDLKSKKHNLNQALFLETQQWVSTWFSTWTAVL